MNVKSLLNTAEHSGYRRRRRDSTDTASFVWLFRIHYTDFLTLPILVTKWITYVTFAVDVRGE